jgi:ketosteroid isomerase-like protein
MGAAPAEVAQEARAWLLAMQDGVRRADFAAGRTLFADDVVAFGSRAGTLLHGLDELAAQQWSGVWPAISDFTFALDQLDCRATQEVALLVVPWTSTGYAPNGTPFDRPGRASILLARRSDAWLAVHTHFSLVPVP